MHNVDPFSVECAGDQAVVVEGVFRFPWDVRRPQCDKVGCTNTAKLTVHRRNLCYRHGQMDTSVSAPLRRAILSIRGG